MGEMTGEPLECEYFYYARLLYVPSHDVLSTLHVQRLLSLVSPVTGQRLV